MNCHGEPAGCPLATEAGRAEGAVAPGNRSRRWVWGVRAVLFAAGAGLITWLGFAGKEPLQRALSTVQAAGPWAPLLFILVYALATVLGMPGSVLTLGAGALFGLVKGTLLASAASTLGATAAFLLARHAAGPWLRRRIPSGGTMERLSQAVARAGWRMILLTRLSPILPFTLLNYAYGLTPVNTVHYVWASWIGMLPGTILYVYLGSTARALAETRVHTPGRWLFQALGLLATLVVSMWITRMARSALREQQAAPEKHSGPDNRDFPLLVRNDPTRGVHRSEDPAPDRFTGAASHPDWSRDERA